MGAVGLRGRRRWGFVIAGVVGVAGTILTVLGLLFVGASLAYYNWDPDINVLGPGLTTYPSLAILVAIVLAHATIVVVVFREAFGASRGLARWNAGRNHAIGWTNLHRWEPGQLAGS